MPWSCPWASLTHTYTHTHALLVCCTQLCGLYITASASLDVVNLVALIADLRGDVQGSQLCTQVRLVGFRPLGSQVAMASANTLFKNHEDYRRQKELEEARKAGIAPAEVDEEGKEINPHIPQYMSSAPWYLNDTRPSLKHQKNWKVGKGSEKDYYDRGVKVFQATKFRKGACEK